MPKLNQMIAVERGLKTRTERALTDIYHGLQKAGLFAGLSRAYAPIMEDGEQLPPESTKVQLMVGDELTKAADQLTQLFDAVATKEKGNTHATANVVVGGQTIIADASVPLLLFLEKQITDWRTAVAKVPVLDRSEAWEQDDTVSNQYRTAVTQTVRTQKVRRNHVKAEATDKHQAQVEVFTEDVPVGRWSLIKFSGAVPTKRRDELVEKANVLLDAVRVAREEANGAEVQQIHIGETVFGYLLA